MARTFAAYMSTLPLNSRVLTLEEILSVNSNANQREVKVKKGSLRFSRAGSPTYVVAHLYQSMLMIFQSTNSAKRCHL